MNLRSAHTCNLVVSLVSLLILLAACSRRPEGVLSASEMEDVLYDIHRAEGIMYVKGYEHGHYDKTAKYYQGVFVKHGITQAEFDSSLVWYTDNPKRFDKIYPKVIDRLTKEKEELAAINEQLRAQKKAAAAQDSVALLPARTVDDWMRIIQHGLPLEWEGDTLRVDTAFVYPYLSTLQDSIQQALHTDTVATQAVTTKKEAHIKEQDKAVSASPVLQIKRHSAYDKLLPPKGSIEKRK